MTATHFQSLTSSDRPFQLTDDQLMFLAAENKLSVQSIISIDSDQKAKVLNQQQLCCLINQHILSQSHHLHQRVCLNVEQLLILATNSNIKSAQLMSCIEENTGVSVNEKIEVFCKSLTLFSDDRISIYIRAISDLVVHQ